MSLYKLLLSLMLAGITVFSCSEDRFNPVSKDGPAPPPVAGYSIESMPGGAKITYQVAPGSGTLYVEAEWQLHDGTTLTAKSSYFGNTLMVAGFRSEEHTSELQSLMRI